MRVGYRRNYLTIQQAAESNVNGELTLTWSTYKTVWGSVTPSGGSERFLAQERFADVSHTMRILHADAPAVTPKMRVSWDSRIFKIHAVLNEGERDKEVLLLCSEDV